MIFVLDASAMIAYLRDEPGADVVAKALLDPESRCHAHALNLCEVFYDFHRASGQPDALRAVADLAAVGVLVDSSLTSAVWQAAGAMKASLRRISLAACFALEPAQGCKPRFSQPIITSSTCWQVSLPTGSDLFVEAFG